LFALTTFYLFCIFRPVNGKSIIVEVKPGSVADEAS